MTFKNNFFNKSPFKLFVSAEKSKEAFDNQVKAGAIETAERKERKAEKKFEKGKVDQGNRKLEKAKKYREKAANIDSPLKKVTDPPKKKYPKHYTKEDIKFLKDQNEDIVRDDDTDKMTKKQERKHRRKVHQYNKNVAKPLNETQKNKIREQLRGMDPKDPEAKLLRKMLNLKKNR